MTKIFGSIHSLLDGIRKAYNCERNIFPDDDHPRFSGWGSTLHDKFRWFIVYAIHNSYFPGKWFWKIGIPILGDWWDTYCVSITLPDGFWRKE